MSAVEMRHQRIRSAMAYGMAYLFMFAGVAVLVLALVVIVLWLAGVLR